MTSQFETVIAGSRPFALSLFAPLTERVGTRPRIAADPLQAAALVPGAGLVVLELQGSWVDGLQRLVAERPELRFVVALPAGIEGAAATLASLGVEAVAGTDAAALLPAVERVLGCGAVSEPPAPPPIAPPAPARRAAPPAVPPPPATPPTVAPAIAAARSAPAGRPPLFEDLSDDEFDLDVTEELPGEDPFAAAGAAGDPFATAGAVAPAGAWDPSATWPSNAPDLELAERALLAAIDGAAPPVPELAAVAGQVAGALSELERAALLGAQLELDAGALRRSAAMRVRVGFAFAAAPPPGSDSDSAAVAAFLGEIDALLSEVSALAANAPAEFAPALGACRNALVKEAIDFSETAQRYVPVEVKDSSRAARPPAKVTGARVLSSTRVSEGEKRQAARQRRGWVALAVAVVVAAAYHGWNYWQQRQAALSEPIAVPGAPAGMKALAPPRGDGPKVLMPGEGKPAQADVDAFKATEELKGNRVLQTPDGALVVVPGAGTGLAAPPTQPAGSSAPGAGPR